MIIVRIARGISQHFQVRVTEWIMTAALFGWSLVLSLSADTFDSSRSFSVIAQYGDEGIWANLCLLAGLVRLASLVVNGTFREFRYAPHLRACASLVSCVFWGQIALGVFVASFNGGNATDVINYMTFMGIEVWNFFRAWTDTGASHKQILPASANADQGEGPDRMRIDTDDEPHRG
ncbi:hypothetical protein [Mesorhizobium silamurunense]|uniref:hypothetical protein n=1 Tax=Mesorhizobium silamurunense TaxID=499528 RepID=UPI0017824833|nr:hypothetical protein [Mesorhizobium silamurunense]